VNTVNNQGFLSPKSKIEIGLKFAPCLRSFSIPLFFFPLLFPILYPPFCYYLSQVFLPFPFSPSPSHSITPFSYSFPLPRGHTLLVQLVGLAECCILWAPPAGLAAKRFMVHFDLKTMLSVTAICIVSTIKKLPPFSLEASCPHQLKGYKPLSIMASTVPLVAVSCCKKTPPGGKLVSELSGKLRSHCSWAVQRGWSSVATVDCTGGSQHLAGNADLCGGPRPITTCLSWHTNTTNEPCLASCPLLLATHTHTINAPKDVLTPLNTFLTPLKTLKDVCWTLRCYRLNILNYLS